MLIHLQFIGVLFDPLFAQSSGGVSESMDGQGCAILALEVVPKNLILHKNPTQKFNFA